MIIRSPKGTGVIGPPRSARWREVLALWEDLSGVYGYELIVTPVFEFTELFERGVGETNEVVTKQMYTFADRRGRSLSLRPEGTAGVMRAYLAQGGTGRWKVAYSGPMFRYEQPQGGRRRQFWQIGVECVGSSSAAADVEVIALAEEFLSAVGVENQLLINSLGDGECRGAHLEDMKAAMARSIADLCSSHRDVVELNPLRILDCKLCRPDHETLPDIAEYWCGPCRDHFGEVRQGLDDLGIAYRRSSRLVRGLDYYSRTTFEYVSTTLETSQSTVLGGGRYDGLAETLGGRPVPGVGFAGGIDRMLMAAPGESVGMDVFLVGEKEITAFDLMEWAAPLRRAGLRVAFELDPRSVKAQFKAATRSSARYVGVVSGVELEMREGRNRQTLGPEDLEKWGMKAFDPETRP
ncbi:MAG: histidine--tRNA ligase [Acidimicrobiia bacterium]|nr:histidine--tRNA ligase [bacterium]MXX02069.1 histidine--tRNA ligase [Acidimicrobiia bacterium]MXX46322.1 histidine--tRNA ligase [Acidimicrobiia bacterium]MXY74103.1 histidine--tRNA ligase [Acidimicrobiia bacterium]MYB79349.1 histidine--tRNA ligase [Acidimicrobiia bacterium]